MLSYLVRVLSLSALIVVATARISLAETPEEDPSRIDLAKLIECSAYDVQSYNDFAMWLTGPESSKAMKLLGMKEEPSSNLLLREFRLSKPISVFGRQTDRIAFASSGALAVLDDTDPHPLARQLGVTAAVDRADKFLAEKQIYSHQEKLQDSGTVLHFRIALDVSTDVSLPGKTLAGCSYSVEVE